MLLSIPTPKLISLGLGRSEAQKLMCRDLSPSQGTSSAQNVRLVAVFRMFGKCSLHSLRLSGTFVQQSANQDQIPGSTRDLQHSKGKLRAFRENRVDPPHHIPTKTFHHTPESEATWSSRVRICINSRYQTTPSYRMKKD